MPSRDHRRPGAGPFAPRAPNFGVGRVPGPFGPLAPRFPPPRAPAAPRPTPPPIIGGAPIPPSMPPPLVAPPGRIVDHRTHLPSYPPEAYADPYASPYPMPYGEMPPDPYMFADGGESFPPTAFDVWQQMFDEYIATRNAGVTSANEAFPETTTGDVRRIALILSRELCQPRYDIADLSATRAAWREALARTQHVCGGLGWQDVYPENERFWLSDSLALAQRLDAVDERRNRIALGADGVVQLAGDHGDPLALWGDLRHFFLARRLGRQGINGFRYPETTVRDVAQVVPLLDAAVVSTLGMTVLQPELRSFHEGAARAWREAVRRVVERSRELAPDATYPENDRFWLRDAKRVALRMSALRDVAGGRST